MVGKLERERLQRYLDLLERFRFVGEKARGFYHTMFSWFSSYLTDHSSVLVARYSVQFINVGYPQSSALIPPLFAFTSSSLFFFFVYSFGCPGF